MRPRFMFSNGLAWQSDYFTRADSWFEIGMIDAIDGLSTIPPTLDPSGLTQYDTSVLSSVNMQFDVTGDGRGNVSADVSLDSSARSVSATDSAGTINLKVDTSDSAVWGSGAQRDRAITSYLAQFDNASRDAGPVVQSVGTAIRICERCVDVGCQHAIEHVEFERSAGVAETFV